MSGRTNATAAAAWPLTCHSVCHLPSPGSGFGDRGHDGEKAAHTATRESCRRATRCGVVGETGVGAATVGIPPRTVPPTAGL